ncbi:rubredoxin [Candidatus Woesearchaeota archaeon]|nr:rubredoxin [Candidatus Woesearchaeota archaeon]
MPEQYSKKMVCLGCGYMYDEDKGLPPEFPPGTPFSTLFEKEWSCPTCGFTADLFEPIETSVWRSRPEGGSIHPGNENTELSDALQKDMGRKE